jgi:superfamily I DNA/RNA helicase
MQYIPLDADLLLVDESQDLSPLSFLILKNQKCRVIGVGDTYQNIYSELMNTVNLFDLVDWKTYYSGNSYRITPETALIANKVLSVLNAPVDIIGLNTASKSNINCTLFTSNYEMLKKIYMGEKAHVIIGKEKLEDTLNFVEDCIKFNSNQTSNNWKLNNALKQGKNVKTMIQHYVMIEENNKAQVLSDVSKSSFRNFKKTVIDKIITKPHNSIKTYCTIHQSKGLTFNDVYLAWDSEIPKWFEDPDKFRTSLNLLYVAITRASGKFYSDSVFFNYLNLKQ